MGAVGRVRPGPRLADDVLEGDIGERDLAADRHRGVGAQVRPEGGGHGVVERRQRHRLRRRVQQRQVLAVGVGVTDQDRESGRRNEAVELRPRIGGIDVENPGHFSQGWTTPRFVLCPAAPVVGIDAKGLTEILLVEATDLPFTTLFAIEAGDDQAGPSRHSHQLRLDRRQPGRPGELETEGLGLDQAGMARVVDLEDVSGRAAGERPAPAAVLELDQQQLVLQAGKRKLAVVVDAKRKLFDRIDRSRERLLVIGLGSKSALGRLVLADHQGAGDVATVASQQLHGRVDGDPGGRGHALQRLPLRQQALAEGECVQRFRSQRQRAGKQRAVAGPAGQRLLRVAAADLRPAPLLEVGDVEVVEPDPEALNRRHRRHHHRG